MKANQRIERKLSYSAQMALGGFLCIAAVIVWLVLQSGSRPSQQQASPEESRPMAYSAAFAQLVPATLPALVGQPSGPGSFVRVAAGTPAVVTDYGTHDGRMYLVLTAKSDAGAVNLYAWQDAMRGWRRE